MSLELFACYRPGEGRLQRAQRMTEVRLLGVFLTLRIAFAEDAAPLGLLEARAPPPTENRREDAQPPWVAAAAAGTIVSIVGISYAASGHAE
jgi:hypothetical protein